MVGDPKCIFRETVAALSTEWCETGLPGRQSLDEAVADLSNLRAKLNVQGLWEEQPTMVTATLDDGIGQGLAVIESFAAAIGIRLIPLGLMQAPQRVIDACHDHQPDLLGFTVLQYDTEDDIVSIVKNLPTKTRVVAGGPVFIGDPDFAGRTGIHHWARNVASFMQLMLGR